MKGMQIQQQQSPAAVEENISNLTSASGEASASSGNRAETGPIYAPHQYFTAPSQTQKALKKKRNLPGNPDPEAEVVALSPKTLMATNRFVCEICSKGFQRDQNLQLHRRGHNLPWKLKQRTSKEIIKKVYVCPEPGCVHHDPSRALGDLTGIKKHFSRKHGEKKWKCDKCSKRYAVQSDWKAHSKTCGTKEYRCDCGTLFSRRDSFITHRAFCDALAEESARAITAGNSPPLLSNAGTEPHQPPFMNSSHGYPMKKEPQNFNPRPENIPPWLACPGPPPPPIFSTSLDDHRDQNHHEFTVLHDQNPISPNPRLGPTMQAYHPTASPHLSATALLQKAAQMGATMCSSSSSKNCPSMGAHQGNHVPADSGNYTTGFGLNLSSREGVERGSGIAHPLAPSSGNKAATITTAAGYTATGAGAGAPSPPCPPSLLHLMMTSLSSPNGFVAGSSFEDPFGDGMLNSKILMDHHHHGSEGSMTRDFLGLRPLSHSDILSMAGRHVSSSTAHDQNQNQINQKSCQGN